ncbi:MAG: protein translocase subunit SecDF [Bacteroidales bacterium]|nr:protein translocase subunit SecDF [Bacteroidales bacterium]
MENKGAIRFFAIVLALVVVYQLSFTFFASKVEKDAVEFAQGDPVQERRYLDSIAEEEVYNFLWLRSYTYKECSEKTINLGLDLKGGMNVILEISVEDVITSNAAPHYLKDPIFTQTMRSAKEKKATSQADFVELFAESFQELSPGGQMAQFFMTPETRGIIDLNTSNQDVLEFLKVEAESAIENSFNVLRNRIDRFGVVQPNIQRLERQGRILIELPGVKDPERVTKLLTGTANLEFWTTYNNNEIIGYLQEANTLLSEMLYEGEDIITVEQAQSPEVDEADAQDEEISLFGDANDSTGEIGLFDSADSTGLDLGQEQMEKENPLFTALTPFLDNEMRPVPGSIVGVAEVKDTALVNSYLARPQIKALFPVDNRFYWSHKPMANNAAFVELYALKATRDGGASMGGKYVTNANMAYGQFGNEAEVHFSMNSEGAKRWANLTRENTGKQIAILLDGFVVSAPNVNSEIKGGSSTITGNFTPVEATDLSNVLKSGKMDAKARVESSEVIGPSLGQSSIDAGLNSFLIAFLVILAYMVFYYSHRAGAVADLALIANMFFLIGVLASLQAVLTLPGIAGIILTIGMSVDANVLIYERIREELTAGKGVKLAVADGYKKAYSAIIDANVTTLLTGVILYLFGTGPIKGFATTLVIGILTSLFSAIFITRLIYETMLKNNKKLTFDTNLTRNAFKNLNIDFIGSRKKFYVLSAAIVLIGIASLFVRGLNQGVDFTGGRNYVIEFPSEVVTDDIRSVLSDEFGEDPTVITFGEKTTVRITTKYMIDNEENNVDSIIKAKMFNGLQPYLAEDASLDRFITSDDYIRSSHKVGPTIADDIKVSAALAIFFSLLIIFLYILIRFRNWQYGLGALAALVHDVLIVLGLFSIFHDILPFSLEIDQAFIAAILTVVGYSINDTVVVFDRIREYKSLFRKRSFKETMNSALNSTISRTFSTSLSTFVVLLSIFIFGGEVIRGFTFALLVGVIVGTYSSLFIATPVTYETMKKKGDTALEEGKKK